MKTKYKIYSGRDSEFPLPKNVTKDISGAINDIPIESVDQKIACININFPHFSNSKVLSEYPYSQKETY